MRAADDARMSSHTFSKAMEQIAREAEQLEVRERADAVRAAKLARIRKICMTILGIGLVAFAYTHRKEIGQRIFSLVASAAAEADRAEAAEKAAAAQHGTNGAQSTEPGGQKMSKNIQALRSAAADRDKAVEELTKR